MSGLAKIFVFLAIPFLLVGGFYLLFEKRVLSYVFPDFGWRRVAEVVGLKPSQKIEAERRVEEIKSNVEKGFSESRKYVGEAAEKGKTGVFTFLRDSVVKTLSEGLDWIGRKIGVEPAADRRSAATSSPAETASEAITPIGGAPSIYSSVKVNQPAVFVVKNVFGADVSYEIEWGDGQKETGGLKKNELIVVSHHWEREGDYLISFGIGDGSKAVVQQLPIYASN